MNKPEARPKIPLAEIKIDTKEVESFQNQALRPIIKQLHSLLIEHFSVLLFSKKGEYLKFQRIKRQIIFDLFSEQKSNIRQN
ncbi:hypothetical protein ABWH96_17200 [Marivirga tractuosa]|uniref:hypothetical protein n=1 Tax=Marivirga tractuosa TaxID=1006 RepID=UPI0035CF7F2F